MLFFTLYSREYCHLCDDMREALAQFVGAIPHQISMIDVDQDPALLQDYDELVPVLFGCKSDDEFINGPGQELCHYFLDIEKVKAFCNE